MKELLDLADKWDQIAETHGVRQFTGNDHKMFANELRSVIDGLNARRLSDGVWIDREELARAKERGILKVIYSNCTADKAKLFQDFGVYKMRQATGDLVHSADGSDGVED